ncbi:DUF3310 domain-containing protein [Moraxella catarrhalis]|uniref:DUF3310 domain-containing protein n=1 Tax=Moraxella catarrhalis TaxID=480 RepID=A0A3Q9GET2_MORCA|nr:DUF3310 domain-containing protein [Moraxella catarrhalis]AZQ92382.1 hypothetical protein EJK53_1631 [Moraxella catarrhalis]AZQ94046.1 hypothetical protein EJK53_1557 [Moraxella catarrhalis]MPX14486.1 hypothetical protein [Moraxella catarrhalis]MPX26385.1 DUF3310 domain-containing protein [Moraxella catarrhalis]MPX72204.1 DUF3310 domain-containing protein [Moraxella catarrhalis]
MTHSTNDEVTYQSNPLTGDPVNHPSHYISDPSGIECIQISENWSFCLGNALKYLWRNGKKDADTDIQDLEKAIWYIQREIERKKRVKGGA